MKRFPYAKIGKVTTWLTFGIATIIFMLYLQSGDLDFGFVGYFFFLFAVPANIILFIFLNLKKETLKIMGFEITNTGLQMVDDPVW